MKKFLAVLCSLVMLIGVFSTTAFAATSQGLWYEENTNSWTGVSNAVHNATVTPEKDAALNVWLKNDRPVSMQVYETNWYGGYTKVYQTSFGAGERDVRVVDKCNGKKYLVQLNRDLSDVFSPTISILIYQN